MKTTDLTYYDYMSKAPESGKFVYSIMEGFPLGIVITNKKDMIVYANLKMAQLSGYSRKELVGKTSHLFLHFPDQQKRFKEILDNRGNGIYESYELFIRRKTGKPFLGYTVTAPYKTPDEQIAGTIHIVSDITIQKRDAELQALAIGATKSLNSVMITDKYGMIEWVNEGFTKLSGYYLFEVIDSKGELLKRESHDSFMKKLSQAVRKKMSVSCESKNYNKNGEEYWVATTITPVLDMHGGVKELIIIDTDITLRKKAEEELVAANKVAAKLLTKLTRTVEELQKAKTTIEKESKDNKGKPSYKNVHKNHFKSKQFSSN